jgi:hypothetical protein
MTPILARIIKAILGLLFLGIERRMDRHINTGWAG